MRTWFFILAFFICSWCHGQRFTTTIVVSPGVSWYYSSNSFITDDDPGLGFSAAIREEYKLSGIFSVAAEVGYLLTNGSFYSDFAYNPLPEIHKTLRHTLWMHTIDVPVFLKIKTHPKPDRGMYAFIGGSVNYILNAHRKMDTIVTFDFMSAKEVIPGKLNGPVFVVGQRHQDLTLMGRFGIGKVVSIEGRTFVLEGRYGFDIDNLYYPVKGSLKETYNIQRQYVLFNIGMIF